LFTSFLEKGTCGILPFAYIPIANATQQTGIENETSFRCHQTLTLTPRETKGTENEDGDNGKGNITNIGPEPEAYKEGHNTGQEN